jgi:hypothetical protein
MALSQGAAGSHAVAGQPEFPSQWVSSESSMLCASLSLSLSAASVRVSVVRRLYPVTVSRSDASDRVAGFSSY